MRVAKLALQQADVGEDTMQAGVIDAAAPRRPGRVPPLSPEPRCQAARPCYASSRKCTGAITLILGEVERACELDYVHRSRIAVQLGRERHAHPAPGTETMRRKIALKGSRNPGITVKMTRRTRVSDYTEPE